MAIIMENIEVSIIIPAYNVEKYIKRTLNSIINQKFKFFELIVVNDGSTDNTKKIIEETLSNSTINYKLINKPNEGVSSARNRGIEHASGEYLFFLDGDDYITEDCIEKLYNALKNNKCDVAYTNYIKIKDNGEEIDVIPKPDLPLTSTSEFLIELELTMAITFSFCQILYKKSILTENNLFFNPNIEYGEDTEFALKTLVHTKTIAYVNENLIFYLQRENSATKRALFKRYDFINALEDIKEYYKLHNMPEYIIKLITNYRIPKSIWGNTIFLFDAGISYKDIIKELNNRDLIRKLNSFQRVNIDDFIFLFKIKLFNISPKFYYMARKLIIKR